MSDQSEVLKFEQQQQITKLSQAIRIGARLRYQIRGFLSLKSGGSCAIGAAHEAIFGYVLPWPSVRTERYADQYARVEGLFGKRLVGDVMSMNDSGMTREAIADNLEALGY